MRDLDEIALWRDSRKSPDWPLSNFSNVVRNSSKAMRIMEGAPMAEPAVKARVRASHIVCLVTALETLLRDIIALLGQDPVFMKRLLTLKGREKATFADFVSLQERGVGVSELIAADQLFQRVAPINAVMSTLLETKSFLSDVGGFDRRVVIGGVGVRPLTWPTDWEAKFEQLFVVRHRFVHNSHWECKLRIEECCELEELTSQIAHVTWWLVASRTDHQLMTGGTVDDPGPHPALWPVEFALSAGFYLRPPGELERLNRAQRRARAARARRGVEENSGADTSEGSGSYFAVRRWSDLATVEGSSDP